MACVGAVVTPTAVVPTPTAAVAVPTQTAVAVPTATAVVAAPSATLAAPSSTAIVVLSPVTAASPSPASIPLPGVRDLAAAPGGALFAIAGDQLYRIDGPQPTPIGHPPAGRLLALDADRLVVGEMPACARGGGAPLRWSGSAGIGWRDADVGGGRSVEATPWLVRGGDVYALACAGVLVSSDGGRTYRVALHIPDYDPVAFALSADGATAYLAAVSEGGTLRVVRSEKRGADWSAPTTIDTGQGRAALALADDRLALATAQGVKLSRDRGGTWSAPSGPADATALAFRDATLYAATPRGVLASANNGAWTQLNGARASRLVSTARGVYAITPEGAVALTSS